MGPRKRARPSSASTPLAEAAQPRTPIEASLPALNTEEILNDPWTDDQETSLFKSMIRWKPTGMHKHFRMLSISQSLRSHGYTTSEDQHTRIPGIWAKLHSLYDLEALDERELEHEHADDPDPTDPSDALEITPFSLPEDEYGDLIWERRFTTSPHSSPPVLQDASSPDRSAPQKQSRASRVKEEDRAESTQTTRTGSRARGSGQGRSALSPAQKDSASKKAGMAASSADEDSEDAEQSENEDEDEDENASNRGTVKTRTGKRGGRGGRRGGRGARRAGRKR